MAHRDTGDEIRQSYQYRMPPDALLSKELLAVSLLLYSIHSQIVAIHSHIAGPNLHRLSNTDYRATKEALYGNWPFYQKKVHPLLS